ncbi:hypothetical protein [Acinetobacter sp. SEK570]|uniref:hypothetical protein n=1 Tax=unclassified Acinetobacter TaxID=196816 RepID=UPI0039A27049
MQLLDVFPYCFNVIVKNHYGVESPAKLLMELKAERYTRFNAESWVFKNHYFVGLEIGKVKSESWNGNNFTMPNGDIYTLL